MKKFILLLSAIFAMSFSTHQAAAGDFNPESGVKYCLKHKGTDLVLGSDAKNKAVLQTPKKAESSSFERSFVANGNGGYTISNSAGMFLYWKGYSVEFKPAYSETESNSYYFDFMQTEEPYYRLTVGAEGTNCVAPDAISSGAGVFSDKPLTFPNGEYEIIKASDITYTPSVELSTVSVQIMKEEGVEENSARLQFTPVNFNGTVTLSASEGFSVNPSSIEVIDGKPAEVTVLSSAEIGAEGTVALSYDGGGLASVPVTVIEPAPYFYIINLETSLAIGGETEKAVLGENTRSDDMMFRQIPVPGKDAWFYLVQKSSGLYFRNVDSGSGVAAHYCEFGPSTDRAEWTTWENGDGVTLKNSRQDRILVPTSITNPDGAGLMCYGISGDAGSAWQLINVNDMPDEEPMVEVKNTNVLVEQDGISFTTDVRAMYLDGGYVTVVPSKDVTVSTTTIEDSFKRTPLTISTSAPEGTECFVKFMFGEQLLETLEFTVVPRFNRYIIRYNGGEEPMALGTESEESTQPVFVAYDMANVLEQFIVMPVGDDEGHYNLVQESTYRYLGCQGGWDATLANSSDNLWLLEGFDEDPSNVTIRSSKGVLSADDFSIGSKVYTNKSSGSWNFEVVGQINVSESEIVLADRSASAVVTVTAAGLPEDMVVTVDGAARVDKTTLPAEGGEVTVSLDQASEETSGTVTFASGHFKRSITVRLISTDMTVSVDKLELVGKGATAIFTVNATDISEAITITPSEGFKVSVSTIDAAMNVVRTVSVSYEGKVAADGKITVACGDMTREIMVSATFNPDIFVELPEEGFVFDNGIAYFVVTPVDLFEPVVITSSAALDIEPSEIDPDRKDEYVFFTAKDATPSGEITITLSSGSVVKTEKINYQSGVASISTGDVEVYSVSGVIRVDGVENARVTVTDLTGRIVADSCENVIAVAPGMYIVSVCTVDGDVSVVKVLNK